MQVFAPAVVREWTVKKMAKTQKDRMEILNLIRQILKGEDTNVKSESTRHD